MRSPVNGFSPQERFAGGSLALGRSARVVLALLAVSGVAVLLFWSGLHHVVRQWSREEYSYGYVIFPLTAWLIWNGTYDFAKNRRIAGSWWAVVPVALAVLAALLGRLAKTPALPFYGFVIFTYGLALAVLGWRGLWALLPAISFLWFAFPLPSTLYVETTLFMQLISSELGAAFIRLFGIPVFLEGNIIDLGIYKLQVAEACSGLRYLFSIATVAYLVAYLYAGPLWQKALIFLSTAPITILINSLRIGIAGVLVRYGGIAFAEGFLHWFEGYAIFLVGLLLLAGETWLLARVACGSNGPVLRFDRFWPLRSAPKLPAGRKALALLASVLLLLSVAAVGDRFLSERQPTRPERRSFVMFPSVLGAWRGSEARLESYQLKTLGLDDYLLADYVRPDFATHVELFVAYYDAQSVHAGIHSPSVCIPAGGWEIAELDPHVVPVDDRRRLTVNRAIVVKGLDRRLVYYWFQMRGRSLTNEHAIKAANVWDALARGRTDGALIRLETPLVSGETAAMADERLIALLREVHPHLPPFIPE
jgi:exosortase D (VPLPA-CTERM-specific)